MADLKTELLDFATRLGKDAMLQTIGKDATTERGTELFARNPGDFDGRAKKVLSVRSRYNDDATDKVISSYHVRTLAEGGTRNGPQRATLGFSISTFKEGFGKGTAKRGEIDGLYIVVGQDSPRDRVTQDACGALIDVRSFEGVGFIGGIEGVTRIFRADNSMRVQIGYQVGCIDTSVAGDPLAVGLQLTAMNGLATQAIRLSSDTASNGAWSQFISANNGQKELFVVTGQGEITLAHGTAANRMTLAVNTQGFLAFRNEAGAEVAVMNQNGALSLNGTLRINEAAVSNSLSLAAVSRSVVPVAGGRLYYEAGTGNLVYHNGSGWRVLSSTAG